VVAAIQHTELFRHSS